MSKPSFIYELGPDGARKLLDDIQAAPIDKPDVDENGFSATQAHTTDWCGNWPSAPTWPRR
jgi:hypothetical protein